MTSPNQLAKKDQSGQYEGRKGRHQLYVDLYEAYSLYDSPNAAQTIDTLFYWYGEDTEKVITDFRLLYKNKVIVR